MQTAPFSAAEDRLRRRVQQYMESGQTLAAQATLESLVQKAPRDGFARVQLAQVLMERGQLRAATHQLLQTLQARLDDPALVNELARRLYLSGETLASRHCLELPAVAQSTSADVLAVSARLRWMLDEIPEALALMERAMAAHAEGPDEYFLYATLLQFSGRLDEAGNTLSTCLDKWPTFGGAAMAQARLRRQTPNSNHVAFLREQLHRIPADSTVPGDNLVRAEFESALFKELEDLGEYDAAWGALARCNGIMHALNPYDAASEEAITDAIIDRTRETVPAVRSWPAFRGPVPIFVIGMPRSGTTLLDRMISGHSKVTSAGEINDFLRQLHWVTDTPDIGPRGRLELARRTRDVDIQALGARYLEQTQWRAQGHAYYINKLPTNFHFVDLIRRALPHAPILHMVREPMDVCFSNFKAMFGNTSAYSYDMRSVAHYFLEYRRLMAHWRTTLPEAMLDIPYAALVTDPAAVMQRVLDYCGLDFEEACIRPERNALPVASPSSTQVREAIHGRGVGQWTRYAEQLEPLRQALA